MTQINAVHRGEAYPLLMPAVSVSPFVEADLAEAVVLAGLGALAITPGQWLTFARSTAIGDGDGPGGLVARDGHGRLSGLVLFAISHQVRPHRRLSVEHLICFDLFEPALIADALIAEMLRLAALKGCDQLSLVRSMPDANAASALVRASDATALLRIF